MQHIKCFFPLFMLVFLIGLLIHLLIPIQLVTSGTLRIEKSYNSYKLTIEQELIRSLAKVNSLVLGKIFQRASYPIRSMFNMFEVKNRYENVDMSKFQTNSAYQIANMNSQQLLKCNFNLSMWYMPNVSSIKVMNQVEKKLFLDIYNNQPFLIGLGIKQQVYNGIIAIEYLVMDGNTKLFFANPSSKSNRYSSLESTVFEKHFNKIFDAFKLKTFKEIVFYEEDGLRICSPYFKNQKIYAVVCGLIEQQSSAKEMSSLLTVPKYSLSSTDYYYIRPMYPQQNHTFPQIISKFSMSNLTDFKNYEENTYFQFLGPQQSQRLFDAFGKAPQIYMFMTSNTKTINVLPIETLNYLNKREVRTYLVTINNFEKSELNSQSRYQEFLLVMTVPAGILFLISLGVMAIIMKHNFNKIVENSEKMSDYCRFIKLNDLNLQIIETDIQSDFKDIFDELQILNILNKLVTPAYFQVSVHERAMRLIDALQIFSKLGYDKQNIYFYLYECYKQKGELENSLKFLQFSIDSLEDKLEALRKIKTGIIEDELVEEDTKITISQKCKKEKYILKNLRFQLFCSVRVLYEMHRPGDNSITSQITKNINQLQKLNGTSFKVQNLYCLILQSICELDDNISLSSSSRKLKILQELMDKCSNSNYRSTPYFPNQILISYWHFLNGKILAKKENYLEAYELFILSLDGERFDALLHEKIKQEIENITKIFSLCTLNLKKTFFHQKENKSQREFIFVYDTSNPHLSKQGFQEWKKEVRSMTSFIFDEFVRSEDRIGINEFCLDFKVNCNLIEKGGNQKLLKKQLLNSVKAKSSPIYSELLGNLRKAIERTCDLKDQKVFIIFLKEGESIRSEQILSVVSKSTNSKFIFMLGKNSERVDNCGEKYFVLNLTDREGIQIILQNKRAEFPNKNIYLY